jgi:SAM-dependent methyltransferase
VAGVTLNHDVGWEALHQAYVFRRALPLQLQLREVMRLMGDVSGRSCVDICPSNTMLSYHLRRQGGAWQTVVGRGQSAAPYRAALVDGVTELVMPLPFETKSADLVVLFGGMENQPSDMALVEECHRILRTDGHLIVHARHRKSGTLIHPLRSSFGLTPAKGVAPRDGYTESELFNVLKSGFDVHQVRSYARFFVAAVDTVVQGLTRARAVGTPVSHEAERRVYMMANLFYRLADQLDLAMLFSKGHFLLALAKRRRWRPRDAPVLVDGRSISEAVLSRAAE